MCFRLPLLVLILLLPIWAGCDGEQPVWEGQTTATDWPEINREHRPWAYWWWMGSAVNEADITRLLEQYRAAGFGGMHVIPIYGVKGYEEQFIDFLSPRWVEVLSHAAREAERLGMGLDVTTGTGWPYGGPHITPDLAAAQVFFSRYTLKEGQRLAEPIEHFQPDTGDRLPLQVLTAYSDRDDVLDLTSRVDSTGRLDWQALPGLWELVAVFQGWTAQAVKRAAPGGEGPVMDYFSKDVLQRYLEPFDSALTAPIPIRAFYHDSYEVYGANWTSRLFDEFERRRGYDLRLHVRALDGSGDPDYVARVKGDYRHTMAELLLEGFAEPWVEWAHRRGAITRNEAHGSPGNLIDLYAAADIPETESFGPSDFDIPGLRNDPDYPRASGTPNVLLFKFASSAANVAGRKLVSSETATWLGEHFRVALSQVKPEVDHLFVGGINHIFYHGVTYSPPDEEWPGWLFYASTNFAPSNPFWRDLPALNDYVARVQTFLQTGRSDHDVLVYFPIHDLWHTPEGLLQLLTVHDAGAWLEGTKLHEVASLLNRRGYTFDYISDRYLDAVQPVEDGLLVGGNRYCTILVPETEHVPVETFERLIALAEAGATVLFQNELPVDVPGLGDLEARRARLQTLIDGIRFELSGSVREARVGKGWFIVDGDVEALVARAGARREAMADRGLSFTRRVMNGGYVYFVANLGPEPVEGWVPLGVRAESAVLFDAVFARTGMAAMRVNKEGQTEVYLQLLPGESRILRTYNDRRVDGDPWPYHQEASPVISIEGTWRVTFIEGGPTLPPGFTSDSLGSWTESSEEAARFAGTARYEIRFPKPEGAAEWLLDLGTVAESARVRLNGQEIGTVWSLPFRIPLGEALQDGENVLEVEVTNLAANRIADLDRRGVPWKKFYDANVVNINYRPFDASSWPPMPSGLLDPVRLVGVERITNMSADDADFR